MATARVRSASGGNSPGQVQSRRKAAIAACCEDACSSWIDTVLARADHNSDGTLTIDVERLERYRGRLAREMTDRLLPVSREGLYCAVSAGARIGRRLQEGPATLRELVDLVIAGAGLDRHAISRADFLNWRNRVLRLLDSISAVGGLPVWEAKTDAGELIYDLLRP